MANLSRVYRVDVEGAPSRLVRAITPAQSVSHVARGMIEAGVASQNDLIKLMGQGVKIEDATKTTAPEDAPEIPPLKGSSSDPAFD